jgi:lipopolysaccharide/colanic/teichoic acid biosynthesis glycosyltransferase
MTKRVFDIVVALFFLSLSFWLIIISGILAAIDTKTNGIFIQERIGQFGKTFKIYKLRTVRESSFSDENRISKIGLFLRKYRMDELPQLFNILKGEMSIVGPRPDVSGYYNLLEGESRKILELKPGLTSMAALKYYNEDALLKLQSNPLDYNDTFIFPDKVKLNLHYYYNNGICGDVVIILETVWLMVFRNR